jgi:hypothetical protein
MIKLFLAREKLVSDIPAGDGIIANLFLHFRKGYPVPLPSFINSEQHGMISMQRTTD